MELDPSQEKGSDLMVSAPFGCVVGGPGCGKTTTLRHALDRLDAAGSTYALAAPTGKAAKRMSEATGRDACTIHRLLRWTPNGFSYNRRNTLPFDAIFVDESSMLDVELADALFDAIDPTSRLVLIGDANQLPSVGPGRILADLVESEVVPVARLTKVHRSAETSWICRNAPKVLTGAKLELEGDFPDFRFIRAETGGAVELEIAKLVVDERFREAQVLTPQRTRDGGVESLNKRLQRQLNPPGEGRDEWKLGDAVFRVGDRVIQTRNDYKLEVFNGEVGKVVAAGERLIVDFEDRKVVYGKGEATALDLAYALTVHKSQGSEFPWVICVVHSAHTFMLTRQLFYTAITRAKKGVIIVGNAKGIAAATEAKTPPKRNTALVKMIRELTVEVPAEAPIEVEAPVETKVEESKAIEAAPVVDLVAEAFKQHAAEVVKMEEIEW